MNRDENPDGIIPEDFDLKAALKNRSSTEDPSKCPNCRSQSIRPRLSGRNNGSGTRYFMCKSCGHKFPNPT